MKYRYQDHKGGPGLVEFALLMVFIGLLVIFAFSLLGFSVRDVFAAVVDELVKAPAEPPHLATAHSCCRSWLASWALEWGSPTCSVLSV
jgi:Flp pilus assembly pilin Flp